MVAVMIDFSIEDRVAVIAMDDGKANAISHALVAAVSEALERAEHEARAVAMVGREGRFCAGFDLNEFNKGAEPTRALLKAGAGLMLRIFQHPQPLVLGCTGHAVAGGALWLLAGDTRIGARGSFKIGLNETAIGMVIPRFGLELANYRLSRRHLQAAVIQARMFGPEEATDAGYLDEVVDPSEVRGRATAVAQDLAKISGDAYAGNKRDLRAETIARLEAAVAALDTVGR